MMQKDSLHKEQIYILILSKWGQTPHSYSVIKGPASLAIFLGCVYILRLQMRWAWLEAKEKKYVSITVLWQNYLIIEGPLNLSMLHLIQFNFKFFLFRLSIHFVLDFFRRLLMFTFRDRRQSSWDFQCFDFVCRNHLFVHICIVW